IHSRYWAYQKQLEAAKEYQRHFPKDKNVALKIADSLKKDLQQSLSPATVEGVIESELANTGFESQVPQVLGIVCFHWSAYPKVCTTEMEDAIMKALEES